MRTFKITCLTFLFAFSFSLLAGQDRIKDLEQQLKEKSSIIPGLNDSVNLSVQNWELHTFIRSIGKEHKINIAADPNLRQAVTYDFTDAAVSDVFLFLCSEYSLDIKFRRSIISFVKYQEPVVKKVQEKREIELSYNTNDSTFTASFKNDSLIDVLNYMTDLSGVNFQINSKYHTRKVKANIKNLTVDDALKIILEGEFKVRRESDAFIVITPEVPVATTNSVSRRNVARNNTRITNSTRSTNNTFEFEVYDDSLINLSANKTNVFAIIEQLANRMEVDFFVLNEPDVEITMNVSGITFENLMETILLGSDYSFKKTEEGYLIGKRDMERINNAVVFRFQQRSASEEILNVIPQGLTQNVDIIRVPELNGLVLTGPDTETAVLIEFLKSIDTVIPLISIEVMIVSYNRSTARNMGMQAGWDGSKTNNFSLNGNGNGANVTLTANSINNLLATFEGFGLLNLGQVSSNFYLQLDAMESAGVVKKESTPKLSTLNGHEASMSIKSTEWYVIEQQNINPGVNPIQTKTTNYQSVDAEFSVTIEPLVSGQEYITLKITVQDSDFGTQINPSAPPSKNTKKFESMIRVKNGEMILLGGLTESSVSKSDSGVPGLSRIPVLKWFFSNSSKSTSKEELNIFIKTTVIY